MHRFYGACLFAAYAILEPCVAVRAASANGLSEQVRVVSREEEYDTGVVWNIPPLNDVPVTNSNALRICDCEYASTKKHGGLLCNKEGYFITNFEADGHWVRPTPISNSKFGLQSLPCSCGWFGVGSIMRQS